MQYSRKIVFADLVIDEKSALTLFELCFDQWPNRQEKEWGNRLSCTLRYYGGAEVVFDEKPRKLSEYFDKPIYSIGLNLRCRLKSGEKHISLALTHGETGFNSNGAMISGEDESWVNDFCTRLNEWMIHAPAQNTFVKRRMIWLLQILAPPFGYAGMQLLIWAPTYPTPNRTESQQQATQAPASSISKEIIRAVQKLTHSARQPGGVLSVMPIPREFGSVPCFQEASC